MADKPQSTIRQLFRKLLENTANSGGPVTQTSPDKDPARQAGAFDLSFQKGYHIHIGTIDDSCALAGAYKVSFGDSMPGKICYHAGVSARGAAGPTDISSLPAGTPVFALIPEGKSEYGHIIGTIGATLHAAKQSVMNAVALSTRQHVDEAHKLPLKINDNGRIAHRVGRGFIDGLNSGDIGWVTETGLRVFLDSFMAQVASDELTGLFVFYHDQLTRLGGYNMQFRSSAHEIDILDDQEEVHIYEGYAMYPWEQAGMFSRENPSRLLKAKEWQNNQPHYGPWEPVDDWQQPFHRLTHFKGYLGQLGKRVGCTKPTEPPKNWVYEGGEIDPRKVQLPGLFDETVHRDGRYVAQSAKGISLIKRCAIITPQRCRRAEQMTNKTGDNPDNYKHSGVLGSGPPHKITGDIKTTGVAPLQRAAAILDLHAYLCNYSGLQPFFWHEKDWHIHEEQELEHTEGKSLDQPYYDKLNYEQYLDTPIPYQLDIDETLSQQDYYRTESAVSLLEDGSTMIYDGYGSQDLMSLGSRFLSAPGDIWIKAGRNIILWAGGDIIASGKKNVEINAVENDVRVKAENNAQMLAGNSGSGGILLESKATSPEYDFDSVGDEAVSAGIMLKSANAPIATWSAGTYVRTGGGDVQPGNIVLDAAQTQSRIVMLAATVNEYMQTAHRMHYGVMQENSFSITRSHEFGSVNSVISSRLGVTEQITGCDNLVLTGNIFVAGGHIFTEYAGQSSNIVPELDDKGLRQTRAICENYTQLAYTVLDTMGDEVFEVLNEQYYEDKKPGNDDLIYRAQFTWRTAEQMKSENFKLYEDKWQQAQRIIGAGGVGWREKDVETVVEGPMKPYPGKDNWEGNTFYQQNLAICGLSEGYSKPRKASSDPPALADEYDEPEFEKTDPVTLEGSYLVTRS